MKYYLSCQLYGVFYPLFDQEVKMNLKCWKVVILLLVILKSSNNQAELFLFELFVRIGVEYDDGPVVFSLE